MTSRLSLDDFIDLVANEIYSVLELYARNAPFRGNCNHEKDNDLVIFLITRSGDGLGDIFNVVQKALQHKSDVNILMDRNVLQDLEKHDLLKSVITDDVLKHVISDNDGLQELLDKVRSIRTPRSCSVFCPSLTAKYISKIVHMIEDDALMEVLLNAIRFDADLCVSTDIGIQHMTNRYYVDILQDYVLKLKQLGIKVFNDEKLNKVMLELASGGGHETDSKDSCDLLTYDNVVDAHRRRENQLYVGRSCIITPLALDASREYDIRIIKDR